MERGQSVNNEQSRAAHSRASVGWISVSYVVALPSGQDKSFSALDLDTERAAETQNHVALRTPMIRGVSRRVLNHPNPNVAEFLRLPGGNVR